MSTFTDVKRACGSLPRPDGLEPKWESPFRMLGGAAYSIGIAEGEIQTPVAPGPNPLPIDWWQGLENAISGTQPAAPWLPVWRASYSLTNALFRIASAVEKACYLTDLLLDNDRSSLWADVRNNQSQLCKSIQSLSPLLGSMPGRGGRDVLLDSERSDFARGRSIKSPLLCAFIQTDRDKHVAYLPLKELGFDLALAVESYLEAAVIWADIVSWKRYNEHVR